MHSANVAYIDSSCCRDESSETDEDFNLQQRSFNL